VIARGPHMWSAGAVSHDLDRPEHDGDARPWYAPPQEEVPGILPVAEVVFSTPVTAMAVVGGRVFSNGLELQLELRARRGELDDDEWERVRQALFPRPWSPHARGDERALSLAVALDEMQPVEVLSQFGWPWEPRLDDEVTASLTRPGGRGNPMSMSASPGLWLWRLPRARVLTLIAKWPAMEVPEHRVQFNVSEVAKLTERAHSMWRPAD
jgi:hypothetical protein